MSPTALHGCAQWLAVVLTGKVCFHTQAMTALKGCNPFATPRSKDAEDRTKAIIREEIGKRCNAGFLLKKEVPYSDIFNENKYAFGDRGYPTELNPDPGFIYKNGHIVAIPETKYQDTNNSAVERCFRWVALAAAINLPMDRLIFSFYGPGFVANIKGHIPGQTGGAIETCRHLGVRFLTNPTDDEFLAELCALLDAIP